MVETRTLTCPVCGVAKDFVVLITITDGRVTLKLVECPTCKVLLASG